MPRISCSYQLRYDTYRYFSGRFRINRDAYGCVDSLDILLFDDAIIWGPGLRIPDPDIWTRPFLAAALVELTPNLVPPDRRQPLAEAGCLRDAVLIPALDFSNELHKRFCE